jgi:hypothetical protein
MVSRDRTVVLTIFLVRNLQAFFLQTLFAISANQATATMRLTVKKDRKKPAA